MPTIHIEQLGLSCQARKGKTILEAALAAGISYPHNCRVGECGACKSRLVSGEVFSPVQPDPVVLSPAERAAGLILACRSWPKTDVNVACLSANDAHQVGPIRQMTARVVGLEDATHDIKRLRLEIDGPPLAFLAGQYAQLRFAGQPPRSFSMANRPDEPILEFHIRKIRNGGASAYVAEQLQLGEKVQVEGPFGSATLKADHDGPIVAAAGGSGLAPISSIVRTALVSRSPHPIYLYFGARTERDVYNERILKRLTAEHPNLRVEIVLSGADDPGGRRMGFVHEAIAQDLPTLSDTKFYIAGPPPMVAAVAALARSRGAHPDDIHADAFTAAQPEPQATGVISLLCGLFRFRRRHVEPSNGDRDASAAVSELPVGPATDTDARKAYEIGWAIAAQLMTQKLQVGHHDLSGADLVHRHIRGPMNVDGARARTKRIG
jgi:CDP-4-dehydro-6-deoxyglucose reductase/ferredoxin-NAD(P)+ reductase (naphthalene dioxygenase ferredoxin-specific)